MLPSLPSNCPSIDEAEIQFFKFLPRIISMFQHNAGTEYSPQLWSISHLFFFFNWKNGRRMSDIGWIFRPDICFSIIDVIFWTFSHKRKNGAIVLIFSTCVFCVQQWWKWFSSTIYAKLISNYKIFRMDAPPQTWLPFTFASSSERPHRPILPQFGKRPLIHFYWIFCTFPSPLSLSKSELFLLTFIFFGKQLITVGCLLHFWEKKGKMRLELFCSNLSSNCYGQKIPPISHLITITTQNIYMKPSVNIYVRVSLYVQ